jgi:hypothetical protein
MPHSPAVFVDVAHSELKSLPHSVAEVWFGLVQHHFLLNLEPEPTIKG